MGMVSDYLKNLISEQVDERRLVVWFDPEKNYCDFFKDLSLHDTKIVSYEDSFFKLRYSIDEYLNNIDEDTPPRLLVYVPLEEENTYFALAELTKPGVVLKPGQHPWQLNTRLSVVAKGALKNVLPEDEIQNLQKKIDGKKITLNELDRTAEKIKGITPGVIDVIFDTKDPLEVSLYFLNSDHFDSKIQEKDALGDLITFLEAEYSVDLSTKKECSDVRDLFARNILLVDFLKSLKGEIPPALSTIKRPERKTYLEACEHLAKTWRSHREYRESYINHAQRVEKELRISELDATFEQIKECETFKSIEESIQTSIEKMLTEHPSDEILKLANSRQKMFWSESKNEIKSRWTLINLAGSLLLEANRINESLRNSSSSPKAMLEAYSSGKKPWCMLDTYHRRIENRFHLFEFSIGSEHESLKRLITRVRQRYMEIGGEISKTFIESLKATRFSTIGIVRQTEIYNKFVSPLLRKEKIAYILVDAMRFEMAKELASSIEETFDVEVNAALGMVPSITPVGMAALLPGAERSFKLESQKEKNIIPSIDGQPLKDRQSRMNWIENNAGFAKNQEKAKVVDFKLGEVLQMLPKVKKQIEESDLIVVTSQEIDKLGETGDTIIVRNAMDNMIRYIARGIRNLAQSGCQTIVISADHGYFFGEEIESDMKIPSPKGQEVKLDRRFWIGKGGDEDPAFFRMSNLPFSLNDDLEIAVPWGFGVFRIQGGTGAYFHGGMSPQELIIPVLLLHSKAEKMMPQSAFWKFAPLKEKITTRTFTVRIEGKASGLEFRPPRVRVEIRDKDDIISETFNATYGFDEETKEIQLQTEKTNSLTLETNDVNLVLIKEPKSKTVNIYLIDANTDGNLEIIKDIGVKLSI